MSAKAILLSLTLWYLLVPPLDWFQEGDSVVLEADTIAPTWQWTVTGTYDSLPKCDESRKLMMEEAMGQEEAEQSRTVHSKCVNRPDKSAVDHRHQR